MDHDNLDFIQAVEDLAKRKPAWMSPGRKASVSNKPRQPTDSPLYPLLTAAADYYRQALKSHPSRQAAVELPERARPDRRDRPRFRPRLCPARMGQPVQAPGRRQPWQVRGDLIDAGLLIENAENPEKVKRYDRFRDRVMFPIRDSRGRIIAFGGRVLGDDKPKYLNSPETPVFHKGQELYGLFEARKNNRDLDEIMVVEGYMDVIALAQQGLRNAVATLGTATSEEHIKRLFRLVPKHSVLLRRRLRPDARPPGAPWKQRHANLTGRPPRTLPIPPRRRGPGQPGCAPKAPTPSAHVSIQQAQPLADYFFQQLMDEADPRSLEGKAHLDDPGHPTDREDSRQQPARPDASAPERTDRTQQRQQPQPGTATAHRSVNSSVERRLPGPRQRSAPASYDSARRTMATIYEAAPSYIATALPPSSSRKTCSKGEGKLRLERRKTLAKAQGRDDFQPRAPRTAGQRRITHPERLAHPAAEPGSWHSRSRTPAISPLKTTLYAQLLVALLGSTCRRTRKPDAPCN